MPWQIVPVYFLRLENLAADLPELLRKGKTESRVESIAKGYIEKDPSLSYTDAVAKAWENNPDLLASYDDEAGF